MYAVDITRKGFIWFDNFLINLSLYWHYHFNKLVLLYQILWKLYGKKKSAVSITRHSIWRDWHFHFEVGTQLK